MKKISYVLIGCAIIMFSISCFIFFSNFKNEKNEENNNEVIDNGFVELKSSEISTVKINKVFAEFNKFYPNDNEFDFGQEEELKFYLDDLIEKGANFDYLNTDDIVCDLKNSYVSVIPDTEHVVLKSLALSCFGKKDDKK